jgi:hypothetical protein
MGWGVYLQSCDFISLCGYSIPVEKGNIFCFRLKYEKALDTCAPSCIRSPAYLLHHFFTLLLRFHKILLKLLKFLLFGFLPDEYLILMPELPKSFVYSSSFFKINSTEIIEFFICYDFSPPSSNSTIPLNGISQFIRSSASREAWRGVIARSVYWLICRLDC